MKIQNNYNQINQLRMYFPFFDIMVRQRSGNFFMPAISLCLKEVCANFWLKEFIYCILQLPNFCEILTTEEIL